MTIVTITGWRVGAKKVGLNHFLRDRTNLDLTERKEIIDEALEKKGVVVEFAEFSNEDVQTLEELGYEFTIKTSPDIG